VIESIIFDFDGVIVESAEIKTQAFATLFANYPQHIEQIIAFHKANVGLSRFVKFRHIYTNLLEKNLSKAEEKQLGERFSTIVLKQIVTAPLVAGVQNFLVNNNSQLQFFIVSGTPQYELDYIMKERQIDQFFVEAIGSPTKKPAAISALIDRYNLSKDSVIMVGDGKSDQQAADATGVRFVARFTNENREIFHHYPWCIDNFTLFNPDMTGSNK
jgi:phosphoglycolate phosphatase-like HAD superfamily hydrolase